MLQKGSSIIETMVLLVLILLITAGGLLIYSRSKTSTVASYNSTQILAEIKNDGSTNISGWSLLIYNDLGGKLTCVTDTTKVGLSACTSKAFKAGTFPNTLKTDLDGTSLKGYTDQCAYSVSFGSEDELIYKGSDTFGIDCYANGNSPLAKDLTKVFHSINIDNG